MSNSIPLPPAQAHSPAPLPAGINWQRTSWHGESAWCSTSGSVSAIVTEARQRLIYFGAADGARNLLNSPVPHTLPSAQDRWPNQGGHRFWLGPQKHWVWPPITDWEFSAAQSAQVEDDCLVLHQTQQNPDYPVITREYAWIDYQLRCTARWSDTRGRFFGMHLIAVDLPMTSGGQLVRSEEVPLGFVQVRMEDAAAEGFLPHPGVTVNRTRATVRAGEKVIKLGFAGQPLTVKRPGGWHLSILPGPHEGIAGHSPDNGCLSQLWVGGPEYDFAELEQLTPYLRNDTSRLCASTVFLTAFPPAAH